MAENTSHPGAQRRRRRNRNFRGESRGPRTDNETFKQGKSKPKISLGQRILSICTFGILGGKPKPKLRPAAASGNRPDRSSTQPGISEPRGERRERGQRNREREPRPAPQPAEVTSDRLYVGILSYDASESDLFELFSGVGSVRNAEVVVHSRTQRSKGFAFVTMGSMEEAKRAVAELHGKDFMGRPLHLSGAKPAPSRAERDSEEQSEGAQA